ncbi:hypothetical protein DTO027B5_7969 [Paecilomyces variotii]|nr:hypothetical protein DTO027B3_5383 [Paecilomyces variotii]KAJ9330244.1 hypothetical protein DTO027B5_7969 [Paecilomyces variotii]
MDTGIIGPVTVMKSYVAQFGSYSATIHGLIVSSILIPAAISSFFAGRVADLLGRPKGISIGALVFGLGAAIEGAAVNIGMFVAGRCIAGIGEGLFLGNLVVGALTTGPQLLITLGLVTGFFICYGTSRMKDTSLAWRTPYIVLACFSALFSIVSVTWLVPSPRWLTLRGRHAEATAAWDYLEVSHAEREKVEDQQRVEPVLLEGPGSAQALEPRVVADATKMHSFLDVFRRDVRTRTALASFLMAMQQLSGIDGVLYYAPLLFEQAGLASSEASFLASGVSAIVIFVVTIPALIWCDRWGRRHSTIYGGIGQSATMFLIGSLYAGRAVHGQYGVGRWIVIVSIYGFVVIFSITWAVCIKVYVSEIQPQRTRAAATSLAYGSNWVANFIVALTTPILLSKSSFAPYFLFGGCMLLTAIVCILFMHETKGKFLDEIEEAFRIRTSSSRGLAKTAHRLVELGRTSAYFAR